MPPESSLESWAVRWSRFRGIVTAKLKEVDGIPDRIFFVPGGCPVIVEFKKQDKLGEGLQEKTQPWYLAKLKAAGYTVCYCETKDQFRGLMKEYECRSVKPVKSVTPKTVAVNTKQATPKTKRRLLSGRRRI